MNRSELIEAVESLQNLLVAHATGGARDEENYALLRARLLREPRVRLPRFVKTCRDLDQFWPFIKGKFGTYAERRDYLWGEFRPILEKLESASPADEPVGETLESYDSETIHAIWSRALERRESDPDGAITSARSLLESVCKYVLDEQSIPYDDGVDLPRLYRAAANSLNLAPSQHVEQIFKQILGGCQTVVEGLGAMRNRLSDAHGRGRSGVRAAPRHAALAVNLAGAMAQFLVDTWEARASRS